MGGLKIAAAENYLTTGCVLCDPASPLSLGSSKDLFWGWMKEWRRRNEGKGCVGRTVGLQAYVPSSKLQNTFFKLGGKNTGQFLWHQHTFFQDMIYMFGPHFKWNGYWDKWPCWRLQNGFHYVVLLFSSLENFLKSTPLRKWALGIFVLYLKKVWGSTLGRGDGRKAWEL